MPFDPRELDAAVARGIITRAQADALLALANAPGQRPDLHAEPHPPHPHLEVAAAAAATAGAAVYGAGLVAAHERSGGVGLAVAAAAGAVAATFSARLFWRRHRFAAGGAFAAMAALLAPAVTFGLLDATGLFGASRVPWHDAAPWAGGASLVALSACAAFALAYAAFPFPPLAAFLIASAWALAQACAPLLFAPHPTWAQRSLLSAAVGVVTLAIGVLLDGHVRRGLPVWIYAAGLVAFRAGLAGVGGDSIALHSLVDALLLGAAVVLRRPVFALAAALGVAATVGALAESAGTHGLALGLAVGIAIAGAAEGYRRHRAALEDRAARAVAALVRRLLPGKRGP